MLHCPHCEHEFEPESQDALGVYNAKTRILKAVCPECTKNFRLNRVESDRLLELWPGLQKDMQQMSLEKDMNKNEPEEQPTSDFEDKFRDALSIFGLNHKKYETKIQAILKLIERTGASRDWLKYYLQKFTFTNRQNIDSIVDMVFIDEDAGGILPPPPGSGVSNSGGFIQQALPGGGFLLIPAFQQPQSPSSGQPIIINPGRDPGERTLGGGDDGGSVIEELDEGGKVKRRITKGRARRSDDGDAEDPTMKTLKMLKELGIIQPVRQQPETQTAKIPEEVQETLDGLNVAISQLSRSIGDKPTDKENAQIKELTTTVTQLRDEFAKRDKADKDNETKALRDELAWIGSRLDNLQTGRHNAETPAGLTDSQFETHTKHKSLETITESGEHALDKIVDPLNKILEGQNRLNSLMMVRDLEQKDGVAPGTYMKVLQPAAVYTDAQVGSTVDKWKKRAAETPAKAPGVAGS